MDRRRKRVANSQLVYSIIVDRSILCREIQPLYSRSSRYNPINTTRFESACCEAHVYYTAVVALIDFPERNVVSLGRAEAI